MAAEKIFVIAHVHYELITALDEIELFSLLSQMQIRLSKMVVIIKKYDQCYYCYYNYCCSYW